MKELLVSLIIPIFAIILESYPRILNRKFGVDIWTHLLYLKEFHKKEKIPGKIENGFLVAGEYDYPPAFILLLSKFPLNFVEKYEFLFSPFFDALHLLIIFFIVFLLTGNIWLALCTQVIYLLTPIIVLENSSATPRSLGYLLFSVVFLSLFYFSDSNNILFFAVAVALGALIFLSHRFTTQGYLFFALFFSFLERDLIYLLSFFTSLILTIVISRGFYLKVLRGHIGNLKFWADNIEFRFAHQIKGKYETHKTSDFIFRLYNQFLKFPPFVLAITNPWTLPVFFVFFLSNAADPMQSRFIWWVAFSYLLALTTTWIPKLRFLGEGQRYLELSAFPAAYISSRFLFQSLETTSSALVVLVYLAIAVSSLITIVVIQRKGIINDSLRTLTPVMQKMFDYLKSLPNKPKLLVIPHQITTNTIYHTDAKVFVNASYEGIRKISEVYPFMRRPVREIMKKYNLDMILLNSDYASVDDLNLGKHKIVKRTDNFSLIKLL